MVFFDWLTSQAFGPALKKNKKGPKDNRKPRSPTPAPPGRRRPSPPRRATTAPAAYPTAHNLMPRPQHCLSARSFIDGIAQRQQADIDATKLAHYRAWLRDEVMPALDSRGGDGVSARSIELLIAFFGEFLFWNELRRTRFRWVRHLCRDQGALGCTSESGLLIQLDPHPPRRDGESKAEAILSVLVHEVCHALLEQHCCQGQCGRGRCRGVYVREVLANWDQGHGPQWCRLAGAADGVANSRGSFRCRTDWERYGGMGYACR